MLIDTEYSSFSAAPDTIPAAAAFARLSISVPTFEPFEVRNLLRFNVAYATDIVLVVAR